MLVGGVIQYHFDDDSNAAAVGRIQKIAEILQGSIAGVDSVVIRNVVPVVAKRRRKERHQPDRIDAEFLQISDLLLKSLKVPDAVAVAVVKSADVDLVNDCILVPKHILIQWQRRFLLGKGLYGFYQAKKQVYLK